MANEVNGEEGVDYTVRITWKTIKVSTTEEADQKITELQEQGFVPVSFAGSENSMWGVFKLVERVPLRRQGHTVPQQPPSQLLG